MQKRFIVAGGPLFKYEETSGGMAGHKFILAFTLALLLPTFLAGAENLVLNPHLNYKRNNHQGPLIRGDHMTESVKPGVVNYITFYAEFCYNAKRQARTTVDLYKQYKHRVHFVVVDFEYGWSPAQNELVMKYFARHVPQVVILDAKGKPVFNYIGQTPENILTGWLNAALEYPGALPAVPHPMDTPREINDGSSIPFTPINKLLKKF